jgi:hypothetical protein
MATRSPGQRRKAGAAIRSDVARSAHSEWARRSDRADPAGVLIEQGKSRIRELLPIRYGRMRTDPFAFLRGAAAVIAAGLASSTGIRMQACGDAHLAKFRLLRDARRVAGIRHQRLRADPAGSVRVGSQAAGDQPPWWRVGLRIIPRRDARSLARTAARSYREHMAGLAQLSPIEDWNRRIDLGPTLARTHGRAGDPVLVTGYAGNGIALDEAIGEFAVRYADQSEKDWNGFLAAIKAGRIVAADP